MSQNKLNMFVKKLAKKIFEFLPQCELKQKVQCFYYNYFKDSDFKMFYANNRFLVVFKDLKLEFYGNPYEGILNTTKYYLKNYNLNEGDIVVDAGAYIGAFTLIAAKTVGANGKVIAFEPDSENYQDLLKNIALNNVRNVIPINKGLWSKTTRLRFNCKHSGTSSFLLFNPVDDADVFASVVTLDEQLRHIGINKVDFIKMDIEGAEIKAIEGCENTLKCNYVNLAIASYHSVEGRKTYSELERFLANLGYKTHTQLSEPLTTYASK